jgi:ubiquinone/menaquinone biosynthesis C-methylase UbiE
VFHPGGPTFRELVVQAFSSTERGYDLLAPKFDHTPFRTPGPVLERVGAALSAAGPVGRGLDLCCGTGAGMAMLRPLCRERVVGIDFSRGMLSVGRERLAGAPGSTALEWVRGDVLALPFGPVFDVVTCFGALGHVLERDQPRFVAEVARVLRPGGRFVFVTSSRPPTWSRQYLIAWCFDSAMRVRNALVSPPFVMYYLTFLLPDALRMLRAAGLSAETEPLTGVAGPAGGLQVVIARRGVPGESVVECNPPS